MDFSDNTTKIILAVIALAVAGGSIIAYRISKTKNSNNNNKTVNQNRNKIQGGGDIIGGNKTTK